MKTVKELMAKNIFVNKDGSIECINAFVEMVAYYMMLVKTQQFNLAKVYGQVDILRAMARIEGYNWSEIYVEANKLTNSAYAKAVETGLAKAI